MKLSQILSKEIFLPKALDREIENLSLDSRQIKAKTLFFAINGKMTKGHFFVKDAIKKGAQAVLVDDDSKIISHFEGIPIIPIKQLTQRISEFAARFYGSPTEQLQVIGITGTNGKTSCAHLIGQLLHQLSLPCGVIGTLGNGFYGALKESSLTTPDPIALQQLFSTFVNKKASYVAMEVSSHSIDQGRIKDIAFNVAIFTNLTQDHLDYHGNMENYAKTKKQLFQDYPVEYILLNADDNHGYQWIQEFANDRLVYAYSTKKPLQTHANIKWIYANNPSFSLKGISSQIITPWGNAFIETPLIGTFNLSNVLAILSALTLVGIPFEKIIAALPHLSGVPGRMQMIRENDHPLVFIDYSHSPDALKVALTTLRQQMNTKIACVFGCGGNRDRGKRPMMAEIAEALADLIIVTSDNPRTEDPIKIIEEILTGFSHQAKVWVEPDRSKAIKKGIEWAKKNGTLLIAGKGAERFQQIGDQKIPFDDMEVASRLLKELK